MKKIGKEIRTVKQMKESVGSWVKVITHDGYAGTCVVDVDRGDDPVLLTNDDNLIHSDVFWTDNLHTVTDTTYRFGHYACKPHQITEELKSCVRLTRKPRCDAGTTRQQYAGKATKSAKIPETIEVGRIKKIEPIDPVITTSTEDLLLRIAKALESIDESLARMS